MSILDVIITSIIAYNIFSGLKQGAIKMISGLIGIGLGTILSQPIYNALFSPLSSTFPLLKDYPFLFYCLCFIAILTGCHIVAIACHKLLNFSGLGIINTLIGIALGLLRGAVLCTFIVIPIAIIKPTLIEQSSVISELNPVIEYIVSYLQSNEFFQSLFKSYNEIKVVITIESL